MEIKEYLQSLTGDREKFVHEKYSCGFLCWTFQELCEYLGFFEAQEKVRAWKRSQFLEFVYSVPVKTYCEIFRDAWRIEVKVDNEYLYVITDEKGVILNNGDPVIKGEHYREFEARMSVTAKFKELKKHHTHTKVENLRSSKSRDLTSQKIILDRPTKRR